MANFSTGLIVAAVALLDDGGRVLMQKRREEYIHGGLWEFPGGKLEEGETGRQAAVREMSEELGLVIEIADLEPATFASGPWTQSQTRDLVILLYTCRRWRGVPQCRDADAVCWFRPAELAALNMPPLDYPLAERLTAMLGAATD